MAKLFKHEQLSNGLILLGEISDTAKSAAIGFFVKTGSRDETSQESGVSHFLEHMMFKGSKKYTALELTYALGNIGSQANAFTSEEQTVYYAAILPEYFSDMQMILSDMLRPTIDQHEFDTEKKVILEEIALYRDKPHFYLYEHALKDYYSTHTAGNSVLGSDQSITDLTSQQMKDYFNRRYAPNNMILAASGNFDWQRFRADAEKYCSQWKPASNVTRTTTRFSSQAKKFSYSKDNLNQTHLLFLSETCSAQDDERYPIAVLSMIIGDGSGSKLYWDLVESGIAESAYASHDAKDGTGSLMFSASTSPENADLVADKIRSISADARNFSDAELQQAKAKLASRIVLSGESSMGRLMSIGSDWLYLNRVEKLSEVLDRVNKVDRSSIYAALEKFPIAELSEFRLSSS